MKEEFQKKVDELLSKEAAKEAAQQETNALQAVSGDERAHRQAIKQSRSVQGMEKKWQDQDRAVLAAAIAANAPPVKSEGRCTICQSSHRLWVERQLIRGIAYTAIAKSIPGVNVDTFRRALPKHYKEHMDLEGAQVRAILEEESDLLQQNYEEGVKGAFTYRAALDVMIRKGYSDVLDDITTVEPKDIIKFMELADKMNGASATRMVEEARAAVNIFMEAIRNVFTDNLDRDMADFLSAGIVKEVKRLREQNELEAQIEDNMRQLPSVKSANNSNTATPE
jgi:hypothetical protein